MSENYSFGDSDLAASRLEVLAGAFAAQSQAFVREAGGCGAGLAVDLGCGPGFTTHLLAEASVCERAVGLDDSEHFIGLAAKTAAANVSFRLHDVTTVPFPDGPCELIYVRFLLTHQREPHALIAKWATQLRPGGRLLIEEVDAIETQAAPFVEYLAIVEAMLADGGHDLYVGPKLDAMPTPAGLARLSSRVASVTPTDDVSTRMFSVNIRTWKHNAFVKANYPAEAIRKLEESLTDLAATSTDAKSIEWRLRQLVYERET